MQQMCRPKRLLSEIEALGHARMEALKSLAPATIRELPRSRSEEIVLSGKRVMLTVYRDSLPQNRTAVIIQIYRKVFLFYGRMFVIGFVVETDGTLTAPGETLLWDYS